MKIDKKEFRRLHNLILKDDLRKADAIVWLQGDRYDRAQKIVDLYNQHWGKKVIISGNNILIGSKARIGEDNISLIDMMDFLFKNSIDKKDLIIDNGALNTKEQAEHVFEIAKNKEWSKIILVGSSYYQPRAFLTFLGQAKKMKWEGEIINQPAIIAWDQRPAGRDKTAEVIFDQEFEKIKKYKKDIASIEQGIKFLNKRND